MRVVGDYEEIIGTKAHTFPQCFYLVDIRVGFMAFWSPAAPTFLLSSTIISSQNAIINLSFPSALT